MSNFAPSPPLSSDFGYFPHCASGVLRRDGPATSQFSQLINAPRRMRGVFYGWWLVVLSGLTMTVATVPLYHAMAIWSVALESHFGWSRGQLGLALTFTRIEGGLMGPLEGYLTDRLGARRMVLIGLLILGVGFVAFAGVRNLWMFTPPSSLWLWARVWAVGCP